MVDGHRYFEERADEKEWHKDLWKKHFEDTILDFSTIDLYRDAPRLVGEEDITKVADLVFDGVKTRHYDRELIMAKIGLPLKDMRIKKCNF